MIKTEQPIIHHLMVITKKYLGAFADLTRYIPLERYHSVLLHIYQNQQKLTQQDLADYLLVDKSFVVSMVDYLSKSGFVYRETSIEDRRKHYIKLTEKAESFIPDINSAVKTANDLAFKGIEAADRTKFIELTKKLELNLNIPNEHTITIDYKKSKN